MFESVCIDLAKSQTMTELNCKFLYLIELVFIHFNYVSVISGKLRNQGPSDLPTPTNNHRV